MPRAERPAPRRIPHALQSSVFRTSLAAAGFFAAGTLLLFAFIYWRTAGYEAQRIDAFLRHESAAIAREPPGDIERDVSARFAGDLHRQTFAAILRADGRIVAGELAAYPGGLARDGLPHIVDAARRTASGLAVEKVTAIASLLPDGRILVVGRSRRELTRLSILVGHALAWGLIPALLLALGVGAWASFRTTARVEAFRQTLDRIMQGGLHERLPTRGTGETLDILAGSVNRMLDQLAHLLEEVRGVGDGIAHDLRTPLARMRARLEGGRRRSGTRAELDEVVVQAIADLDQCFGTITALLRIAELESGARRSGFGEADLGAIAAEIGDLYQPMAELRNLRFVVSAGDAQIVHGDRDLLFEACANLVDNAIKFAPEGGDVSLDIRATATGPVVRVADSGAGIPEDKREAVLKRFARADASGKVPGSGLGLSLVAAILRLHGFTLRMQRLNPGFAIEMVCSQSFDA